MTTEFGPAPAGAVIVGVDGSSLSDRALAWAAAEAERSGAPLHVVHAFVYVPVVGGYGGFGLAEPEELGGQVVRDAVAKIRADHPDLPVTAEVRAGAAAPQLLTTATDARMIVLGARGHGRLGGMLLGSVSQQVALHATGPVVIARGTADDGGTTVVVGMDGSSEAGAALRFALRYADGLGAGVRVVRAEYLELPPGIPPGAWHVDLVDEVEHLTQRVRAQVDEARHDFPDVDVDVRVIQRRHPVSALVEESLDAVLLVVASRGLGGFAGLLLGSVSQGVLSRAEIPVAIVPRSRKEQQ